MELNTPSPSPLPQLRAPSVVSSMFALKIGAGGRAIIRKSAVLHSMLTTTSQAPCLTMISR